jgi:hypothetical protein
MDDEIELYCPTCFALPGERCRTGYVIRNDDEVLPLICVTHNARLLASHALDHLLAVRLLAAALIAFRGD